MNRPASRDPKADPAKLPGQEIRGIVSLLIILHLLFVFLAMLTSTDSGASPVLRDIKESTPGAEAYLTQLWLDRGYDYHLMNDQPLDWDHHLEATIRDKDDKEFQSLTLPEAGMWPSERRDRWARLAWFVDYFVIRASGDAPLAIDVFRKNLLPGSICAGLIREHPGAYSVNLRCVYHRGISRKEMADPDVQVRDPNDARYLEKVGDFSVFLTAGGRPQTFEHLPSPEVSPLRTHAGATATPGSKSEKVEQPAPPKKSGTSATKHPVSK